ncbi:MAG: molybdopterin-dependent oxidoreductase [Oligoflexia bacterium]|nr:molybdopterin-dependent oxidoreductase [Oligoflexia bacterium]
MSEKDSELVTIGKSASNGISRRKFLQILGASSAAGVAGCARDQAQKVFPFVRGEEDQIPGVSVWYRSTCRECSAGCGIQVRTREGRAVKIEGNPEHPVNHGGLCGLGQAALQALYDPDRVRQPLAREGGSNLEPQFKPISWDEAYARVAAALKANNKKVLITGEETGALDELAQSFSKAFGAEKISFDALQPVALAKASEQVYGSYGIPRYDFEKAQVIVNFGADFLETFVSPCEYARGWAKSRKSGNPAKFIHVEPRLSLTGANADLWLNAKPGSEASVAWALVKFLLEAGRGNSLRDEVRQSLSSLLRDVSIDAAAEESGISADKILRAGHELKSADASLVLAGGTAAATANPMSLQVATATLNLILGNVGKTVLVGSMRKPQTSLARFSTAIASMKKGEVGLVMMHGANPQFNLPAELGFQYALAQVRAGDPKGKPGLIVSFSSSLDESAMLADIILPSHHSLESWGDSRPYAGVHGLVQPVMTPVFDTRAFGDMLIKLAAMAGQSSVAGGAEDFLGYLKASWKKVHAASGSSADFQRFWLESVERGGYFVAEEGDSSKLSTSTDAYKPVKAMAKVGSGFGDQDLVLYPYASVKTFDGRAANRPWLQELPDPITSYVWDAWAEMHPATAAQRGIAEGDVVQVRNKNGELSLAVHISDYVHRDVVAVPLGQGHQAYGRFAKTVGYGNASAMLNLSANAEAIAYVGAAVDVVRGRGRSSLVKTQGSDSQHGREIARTAFVQAGAAHGEEHGAGHAGHHEPKQMYVQREHPIYEWGLAVDLSACTGCGACVVACYAENNIAVVGKEICSQGREMSWLRIDRYFEGPAEELQVSFQPMMCQHCHNAPCEPVCPVFATYHNEEGLNAMAYNRCVGTRYCSNNCTYKVRRFNFFEVDVPEPVSWQFNPDVTKRSMGVMEKCTFCLQRINEAKDHAKDEGRIVRDGEVQPACVQGCPTQALVFGNMKDPESKVSRWAESHRAYKILDHHINTQPAVSYLERVKHKL